MCQVPTQRKVAAVLFLSAGLGLFLILIFGHLLVFPIRLAVVLLLLTAIGFGTKLIEQSRRKDA
jgi:Flp pilus assembly protein TadB